MNREFNLHYSILEYVFQYLQPRGILHAVSIGFLYCQQNILFLIINELSTLVALLDIVHTCNTCIVSGFYSRHTYIIRSQL